MTLLAWVFIGLMLVGLAQEVVAWVLWDRLEKMRRQAEADLAFWERKIKEWNGAINLSSMWR